jgi:hypothetical protein
VFFSATYGYCFSFNYHPLFGGRNIEPATSTFPGAEMGLDLDIDVGDKYYMRNGLTQNGGARIIIHEHNGAPLLTSSGYDIMPNTATSIGLRLVNITRYNENNACSLKRVRSVTRALCNMKAL